MRYGSLVLVLMMGCTTAKKEVGPQGPQGEQGLQGPAGSPGEQGSQGMRGERGREGQVGAAGPAGRQGLQGVYGVAGANGAMGPAGRDGTPCYQEEVDEGVRIVCGADVQVVRHGEDGEQGPVGPEGPMGPEGPDGLQGEQGLQGIQGELGSQGPVGERGPEGPMGPAGPQGIAGVQGERGPAGPPGEMGQMGPEGAMGPQGSQGVPGEDGENCTTVRNADDIGVTIICGDVLTMVNDGLDGLDGAVGPQGLQGVQGESGSQGQQGERGEIGPVGPAGPQGIQGERGPDGVAGPVGPAGPQGLPGLQGERGLEGPQGPAGPQGVAGVQGERGPEGPMGPQGIQGPAGADGQDLVAQCPAGSQSMEFNGNLMYCARSLVFNEPQTWVQCLDECLQVGLFLAREQDLAIICLADSNFFTEGETAGEDAASTPGTCDDGRNNNGDPAVDCDDPACADALNCDVDKRYHFEIVGDFPGVIRMHPLARVGLLGDQVNLCEAVLAFQAGDQLSENEDGSWTRLFMEWSVFEELVATAFPDADAGLEENANPRRCLCGKRL